MTRKPPDPLAHLLARRRIDLAQFRAGREFQKHRGMAGDGAEKWLAKCRQELGEDGAAIIHDVLVSGMTAKQIAAARGLAGEERYFAKRIWECLNTLAAVYGFERGKKIRASGAKNQIIGAQ